MIVSVKIVWFWKCLSQSLGPWAWELRVTDMDGHVDRENLELGIPSCRNGGHQSNLSALPIASVIASVPFDHCSLLFLLEFVDITVSYYETRQPSLSRWSLGHLLQSVLDGTGADLCPFSDLLTDHNILCPLVILRLPGPAGRLHTPDLFTLCTSGVHSRHTTLLFSLPFNVRFAFLPSSPVSPSFDKPTTTPKLRNRHILPTDLMCTKGAMGL